MLKQAGMPSTLAPFRAERTRGDAPRDSGAVAPMRQRQMRLVAALPCCLREVAVRRLEEQKGLKCRPLKTS